MPWVRAKLRDQVVFAKSDESGKLVDEGGTVEVRYKPNDGRLYRARAQNLARVDAIVLPESTCAAASAVDKKKPAASAATIPAGALVAYTDGACSGNPGPAGSGIVLLDGDSRVEMSEYLGIATNNIAELTALLRGLELSPDKKRTIVLHTDSQYSIGVLTKGWKPKANVELIAQIKTEMKRHADVRLVYVPGHSGVPLNERADELARRGIAERTARTETLVAKRIPIPSAQPKTE
jgi:ribonuclease HI